MIASQDSRVNDETSMLTEGRFGEGGRHVRRVPPASSSQFTG